MEKWTSFRLRIGQFIQLYYIKVVDTSILRGAVKTPKPMTNGTITDPTNGKTYNSSLWLESHDILIVMRLLGYVFSDAEVAEEGWRYFYIVIFVYEILKISLQVGE